MVQSGLGSLLVSTKGNGLCTLLHFFCIAIVTACSLGAVYMRFLWHMCRNAVQIMLCHCHFVIATESVAREASSAT